MKKSLLLFLLIIGAFFVVTGCGEKGKPNESAISVFSYHYGSFFEGYYGYDIEYTDGKIMFTAKGRNGVDLDINKDIDKAKLDELAKLINEEKIYKWNDFSESDDNVMDGYGFGLKVEYEDGGYIEASGYGKYPDDYDKHHKALVTFLESLCK